MEYISVKKEAEQFNISERRVKKMYFTLQELCQTISISVATGKNWIKLGKIVPEYMEKNTPYFSIKYVKKLKEKIQKETNTTLKRRRNKKYISGQEIYNAYVSEECRNVTAVQELLDRLITDAVVLDDQFLQILLADCSVQLFIQRQQQKINIESPYLLEFMKGNVSFGIYDCLVKDLIPDNNQAIMLMERYPDLFDIHYIYEEREDILGLLYISCKNMGYRKATGSYYTPTKVVRNLLKELVERNRGEEGKSVLDPCCGTGNFLLQLPDTFPLEKIYGNDIDIISTKLARMNMALRFQNDNIEILYGHITNQDYLIDYEREDFDFIIGNPPWGYNYSQEDTDYLQRNYITATGKSIESYDVFLERTFSKLKKGGVVSFVLPEAILNVKAHKLIRDVIIKNSSIQYLAFLGNAFDKVQCPCVVLQLILTNHTLSCMGMKVNDGNRIFELQEERTVDSECFSFRMNDSEYQIVEKISKGNSISYLKDNAEFALGIVTGNNKKYVTNKKNDINEIVLKGSDINKYYIRDVENYITFEPEKFQQVAATEYYRASEKLLYRFVCNELVFAYDNKQTLSLNSCNIVIPRIPGLDIKYVLAVLNSRVAQFFFAKKFNSIKVLRSHIEQIPIPSTSERTQQEIIEIVDKLLETPTQNIALQLYEKLDEKIAQLYLLTNAEYQIVKNTLDGKNKFLRY